MLELVQHEANKIHSVIGKTQLQKLINASWDCLEL